MPSEYEAFVRILHPARDEYGQSIRWESISQANGRAIHPLAQFSNILADRFGGDASGKKNFEPPNRGSLAAEQLEELTAILMQESGENAQCWMLLWNGWSNLPVSWRSSFPVAVQRSREYWLFRAPLKDLMSASTFFGIPFEFHQINNYAEDVFDSLISIQSPNQWWAEDRSWFIASEIDQDSTIFAGPLTLAKRLLQTAGLECFLVSRNSNIGSDGDLINI
ncbi:hypothetical protein [Austwickia sp. TVS 96-490-7B]|uniref:hypothetical protein n=1 Tax=Austwickia sp. TVS 96-490-7B TaxID=2830843 RepID=UPI001C56FA7C|nr:hypothetical protein [Austwickia sp. TVS 96-490-7B]